jgi:AraC-like DNA-binding protein
VDFRAAERRMVSPRDIVGFTADYEAGDSTGMHSHDRAQLVHGEFGVMSVRTDRGAWLVPPGFAVWVPAAMEHQVNAISAIRMATLYVHADSTVPVPEDCVVVSVPILARELILRAADLPDSYPDDGPETRLISVLRDELMGLAPAPLHLPLPADGRARAVTDRLIDSPADARELEDWGKTVGASGRTLARLFTAETGLSFGRWRQRRRLLAALERLAAGAQVTTVALDLGYKSPSAFIAMFRRELGATPGRYLREER